MQVDRVILSIVDHSPLTGEQVSAALGGSRSLVSVLGGKGRKPRLDSVVSVADVCGVDVVLRDRETGEELGVVDPPERDHGTGSKG